MDRNKLFAIFYFNNQTARNELDILINKLIKEKISFVTIRVNRNNEGFFLEEININNGQKIIDSDFDKHLNKILKEAKFAFSIGGDGTLLFVSSLIYNFNIPLAGIYMGNLGFLTWFNKDDIENLINNLINENYKLDERMMLDVSRIKVGPGDDEEVLNNFVCLNEMSLSKYHLATPLDVYIYVDNDFLSKFKGDGIIISTPNGSTGYSLSSGGPIICPSLSSIIITPIAPHSFTMKPIIIRDYHEIHIYFKRVDKAYLTCDGQRGTIVYSGDKIRVKKSNHKIDLIKKEGLTFFKIITSKLNWGGI